MFLFQSELLGRGHYIFFDSSFLFHIGELYADVTLRLYQGIMQPLVRWSTIWTAAAGSTGKEFAFGGITALSGLLASALGGWDTALKVLVALMVADYVTGVLGAFKTKTVNSGVMFGVASARVSCSASWRLRLCAVHG